MPNPVISVGDKLHIMTRRRFESDVRRHFAGEVTGCQDGLQEVSGYAFVFETGFNEYRRRPEHRIRIFSVGEEGLIVTKLPADVDLARLHYATVDKRLVVTDGEAFSLDINEFGGAR